MGPSEDGGFLLQALMALKFWKYRIYFVCICNIFSVLTLFSCLCTYSFMLIIFDPPYTFPFYQESDL